MHKYLLVGLLILTIVSVLGASDAMFDSNGVKIFYRDEGKGDPVVLIHGYLANGDNNWKSPGIVKALTDKGLRVIVLDTRGHGRSGKPEAANKYGVEMSDDIVRLMKELKIKKAHIVGYSLGSWTAQKFAADHADMVQTLTVGGAGLLGTQELLGLNILAEALRDYEVGGTKGEAILKMKLNGKLPLPDRKDAKAHAFAAIGASGLVLQDAKKSAFTGPTLGLIGERDPLKTSMEQLQKIRPKINVVEIKGAKFDEHLTAFQAPAFSAELIKFILANPIH